MKKKIEETGKQLNFRADQETQEALLRHETRSQSETLRVITEAYIDAKTARESRGVAEAPSDVRSYLPSLAERDAVESASATGGVSSAAWFDLVVASFLRRSAAERVVCPPDVAREVRDVFVDQVVPRLAQLAALHRRNDNEIVAAVLSLPLLDLIRDYVAAKAETWTSVDRRQNI